MRKRCLGGRKRGFCHLGISVEYLFRLNRGGQRCKSRPPVVLRFLDFEIGLPGDDCRLGIDQRHLKIKFFDNVEYIPLLDMLVVVGSHLNDLTRDLWRHVCDLHTDHTVARPWRRHINAPAIAHSKERCYDKHASCKISE